MPDYGFDQTSFQGFNALQNLSPEAMAGFTNTGGVSLNGVGSLVGQAGGPTTPWQQQGLGLNMGTANLALSGLQTLGSLWAAFQAQSLAKKQFNFTKDITETNLANQMKTYNTALADRARSRAAFEGQSQQQMQQYVDQNSLSRSGGR